MQRAIFSVLLSALACDASSVVVLGDSWGAYGQYEFENMLSAHGSNMTVNNVAINGSTAVDWTGRYMDRLIAAVSVPDVQAVWLTVGGNDVLAFLPGCALSGRSREECSAEATVIVSGAVDRLLTAIVQHSGNPAVRIVLFGYDMMSFSRDAGLVCASLPLGMIPSCYGANRCFNVEFIKLQQTLEAASRGHPQATVLNLLGALQAHAGYNASLGNPDLDQYSPAALYGDCIHPNSPGFDVLFAHMWDLFFSTLA